MNSFNNMVSGIFIMSNGFWLNILGRVEFLLKQIIHDVLQATATTEGEVYFSFWSIRTKSFNTKTSISIQIVYCIRHWNRNKSKKKIFSLLHKNMFLFLSFDCCKPCEQGIVKNTFVFVCFFLISLIGSDYCTAFCCVSFTFTLWK